MAQSKGICRTVSTGGRHQISAENSLRVLTEPHKSAKTLDFSFRSSGQPIR
ncbi:unnamed protein product [Strongylus vulgaris]|uniref:Uncharacterized protein n=1 Tax=Strongylus vulgaris TaxID=40348 RepID=A0A3P7M126_STRVU|nr:unnamed protein product [Strongylus vulgaris]